MNKIFPKKLTIVFILLILLTTSSSSSIGVFPYDTKSITKQDNLFNSDAYEYGLQIGEKYRIQYKMIDFFARFFERNVPDNQELQIQYLQENCPFIYKQFKGLSDSLNIKIERLFALQDILYKTFFDKCTITLATGKAAKNNETFFTQNLDVYDEKISTSFIFAVLSYRLISYKINVVDKTTLRYKYAYWGIPILLEVPIMNEEGLTNGGCGILANKSDTTDSGPGMHPLSLLKIAMMTCKNVSEVAETYRFYDRWCPEAALTGTRGWSDKEGNILIIEFTHNYIATVFGNSTDITGAKEGILWHANHHQWLDPSKTGALPREDYDQSRLREDRSRELLEENYGNITLETCKQICRDHGGGTDKNGPDSSDLCCHSDSNMTGVTMFSWIANSKDMAVYYTHRSPCKGRFVKYDFSKKFGED